MSKKKLQFQRRPKKDIPLIYWITPMGHQIIDRGRALITEGKPPTDATRQAIAEAVHLDVSLIEHSEFYPMLSLYEMLITTPSPLW